MLQQTLRTLGILASVMSVVSLIQKVEAVGLTSTGASMLEYYRHLSSFVFAALPALVGIPVPQQIVDVWALSFIGTGAYLSTPGIERSRAFERLGARARTLKFRIGFLLIYGFSGLGIVFILSALSPTTYIDEMHQRPLDLIKGTGRNLLLILAGAALFFGFNAYAPSAS